MPPFLMRNLRRGVATYRKRNLGKFAKRAEVVLRRARIALAKAAKNAEMARKRKAMFAMKKVFFMRQNSKHALAAYLAKRKRMRR